MKAKMKCRLSHKAVPLLTAVVVCILMTTGNAQSGAQKKPFVKLAYSLGILDLGSTYLPGPNTHIRDMVFVTRDECDDPRFAGKTEVVAEVGNLRADGTGRLIATLTTYVGTWDGDTFIPEEGEGVWTGVLVGWWGGPWDFAMHGRGGSVDGLKAHGGTEVLGDPTVIVGFILEPGRAGK